MAQNPPSEADSGVARRFNFFFFLEPVGSFGLQAATEVHSETV